MRQRRPISLCAILSLLTSIFALSHASEVQGPLLIEGLGATSTHAIFSWYALLKDRRYHATSAAGLLG